MISLTPTPFEQLASARGYDLTPAVSPTNIRIYADARTQEAYELWQAGAAAIYRMLTESMLDTPALRENMRKCAGVE